MISGTVGTVTESGAKDEMVDYGNLNLTDETGSVYVYGVVQGWGGKNVKGEGLFAKLGVEYGDKLTIIAYKSTYKGLVEAVGTYFSHVKAN